MTDRSSAPLGAADVRRTATASALGILLLAAPSPARAQFEAIANTGAHALCVGTDPDDDADPFAALALSTVSGTPDPETCDPSSPAFGLSLHAGSVAGAVLRTGELKAFAQASGGGSVPPTTQVATATANASFVDVLTIAGPGPSFGTTIGLELHVEGEISGWGSINASMVRQSASGPPALTSDCVGTYAGACSSGMVSGPGPFAFDLAVPTPVSSSAPDFSVYVGLGASGVNEGEADASSTATLSIVLPDGFTFTSASGVLLTPQPSGARLALGSAATLALCAARRAGRQPGARG